MKTLALFTAVALLSAVPTNAAPSETPRVSIRFEATPVEAAVAQLGARIGAALEWRGGNDPRTVSVELSDVPLAEALERVLATRSFFVVSRAHSATPQRIVVLPAPGDEPRTATAHRAPQPVAPASTGDPEQEDPHAPSLAVLDDPDPTLRRSMLEYASALPPGDSRRDAIVGRLMNDPDPSVRRAANLMQDHAVARSNRP